MSLMIKDRGQRKILRSLKKRKDQDARKLRRLIIKSRKRNKKHGNHTSH